MGQNITDTWAGLDACAYIHDDRALERHRVAASRHLNQAVERAILRVGSKPLHELVDEIGFAGWRPPSDC